MFLTVFFVLLAIFNGSLTSSSTNYSKTGVGSTDYYYQAMHVTNYIRGMYTFRSDSTMNSYGALYDGDFDPRNPGQNKIESDDYSAGNQQFLIAHFLETNMTYTLIYSTQLEKVTGDYKIVSTGAGSLTLVPFTPKCK